MKAGCVLAAIVVIACSSSDHAAPGLWRGTMDTLATGTVVVRNPARGVWDSTATWHIEEELRIGTPDVAGAQSFNDVVAFVVDPASRIWVLDRQTQDIRVFDASGRHVRTIGRKGQGPGEFQDAVGMAWDPAGHLWVVDQGNVRYTLFDTAGHVVSNHPRPISGFLSWKWQGGLDAAGRIYEYRFVPGDMDRTMLLRFGSDLRRPDTLLLPRPQAGQFFEIVRQSMRNRATIPFTPSLTWYFDRRGYLWFGMTAPYRIYQQRLGGDTVRVVEKEYTALAVTTAERDSAVARLKWFTDQGGNVDRSRIPAKKPALDAYWVDDRGDLWVDPVTSPQDDGRLFDVFDPAGRFLGQVRSDFRISGAPVFRGDTLYAVTQDDDGVPYVVRAHIIRRGGR